MTYDRPHIIAQWGGTLPGGEIWSNSVRLAGMTTDMGGLPSQGDLIAWLTGPAKDAVSTFHGSIGAAVNSACRLTFLKMNVVDIHGHYVEQTTHEYVYSPTVPGGSSAVMHPNQVALVVSLLTDFERGPAHRGRFYLPLPSRNVQPSDGGISTTDAMATATAAATFMSALHDQPGSDPILPGDCHVAVMSAVGTGATNRVTAVEVGVTLDTQRRRRSALLENYQRAPIV